MRLSEYKNIKEKEKTFEGRYQCITSVNDFKQWYAKNSVGSGMIFRGINNASYKNYTSLQRLFITHDYVNRINPICVIEQEIENLRNVNGKFLDKYFASINFEANDFSYLSYLQHYKDGVTPLLDFTKNINTALFFMSDGSLFPKNGDGDIHMLEYPISSYSSIYWMGEQEYTSSDKIYHLMCRVISESMEEGLEYLDVYANKKNIAGLELIKEVLKDCMSVKTLVEICKRGGTLKVPIMIENKVFEFSIDKGKFYTNFFISNPNLVAQDGCFLFYGHDSEPLEMNLHCTDIHKSLIPYIKKNYLKDEFTRDKLFPNIDNIISKAVSDSLADLFAEQ